MRTRKSLHAAESDEEDLELPEKAKKELQIDGKDTLKGEKRAESTTQTYKWGGRYYEVTPDTPAEWLKGKPVKDKGKRWILPDAPPSASSATIVPSSSSTSTSTSTTAPPPSSTSQKRPIENDTDADAHASSATKKARKYAQNYSIETPRTQQQISTTNNAAPLRTTTPLERFKAGMMSHPPKQKAALESDSITVSPAPGSSNRSAAPATSIDGSYNVTSAVPAKDKQLAGSTPTKAMVGKATSVSAASKQSSAPTTSSKQKKDSAPTVQARIGSKRPREEEAGVAGAIPAKKHWSQSAVTARAHSVQTGLQPLSELTPKPTESGPVSSTQAKPAWTSVNASSAPFRANSAAKLPPPGANRQAQLKQNDSTAQKITSSKPNTAVARERAVLDAGVQPASRVKSTPTLHMPNAPERQPLPSQQDNSVPPTAPHTARFNATPAAATPRVDGDRPVEAQAARSSHVKAVQRSAEPDTAPASRPNSTTKLPTQPASKRQSGQAKQKQSVPRNAPSKVFPGMFEPEEVRNFSITLVKMARLNSTIDRRQEEADKIFADIQKLKGKLKEKREAAHRLREQLREVRAEEEEMNTDSEDEKEATQRSIFSHALQAECGSEQEQRLYKGQDQEQEQLPDYIDPTRAQSSSDQSPVIAESNPLTPDEESAPADTSKETTPEPSHAFTAHAASPRSSRSGILFPAINRGGQSLRWSPQNVQKNAANTDRAEYAIHRGRLDGESKSARRRRLKREMKCLQTLPDQIRGGSGGEA